MACKNPIHLSGKSNWSGPKRMSVRSNDQAGQQLSVGTPSQECDASAFPVALGVLFEPEGSPVAFIAGGESVLNGGSGLQILARGAPPLDPFPFNFEQLLNRLRAAVCQSNALTDNQVTRLGDIRVNFTTMDVTRLDKPLFLTAQELKTLKFFVMNPYRVISRDELLNEAWGYNNYPSTRTVDNHVLKLRQKLESDPAEPVHFLTVHRVGYKFVP